MIGTHRMRAMVIRLGRFKSSKSRQEGDRRKPAKARVRCAHYSGDPGIAHNAIPALPRSVLLQS